MTMCNLCYFNPCLYLYVFFRVTTTWIVCGICRMTVSKYEISGVFLSIGSVRFCSIQAFIVKYFIFLGWNFVLLLFIPLYLLYMYCWMGIKERKEKPFYFSKYFSSFFSLLIIYKNQYSLPVLRFRFQLNGNNRYSICIIIPRQYL